MINSVKANSPAGTEEFMNRWQSSADDPILPQKMVVVSNLLASRIQRDYVCAGCWRHLNRYHLPDSHNERVVCDHCGDGRGFVRKAFTDRKFEENSVEAIEVRNLLRKLGVLPQFHRKTKEILSELGF